MNCSSPRGSGLAAASRSKNSTTSLGFMWGPASWRAQSANLAARRLAVDASGAYISAMNQSTGEPVGEPLLFDAILTPYRSLSPRGFAILMGIAGVIGFGFGASFIALGAWPIFGFCGAEWLLFYIFFRLNYR